MPSATLCTSNRPGSTGAGTVWPRPPANTTAVRATVRTTVRGRCIGGREPARSDVSGGDHQNHSEDDEHGHEHAGARGALSQGGGPCEPVRFLAPVRERGRFTGEFGGEHETSAEDRAANNESSKAEQAAQTKRHAAMTPA